jgi:Protein of unknown function (DUF3341)
MARKLAVVGIFAYLDELLSAVKNLRKEEISISTVYSPMRSEEIREALGKPALGPGRFFTLAGGILGLLTGISLAWYTTAQWRFIVGGKPQIPVIPTVIPAFEFFILLSVIGTLAGLMFMNRMPKLRLPKHYDKRFSQDRFGILIYCTDANCEQVSSMLEKLGAEEVRKVEE